MAPTIEPVLLAGTWTEAQCVEGPNDTFRAVNPVTGGLLAPKYPVSCWSDIDEALDAGLEASWALRDLGSKPLADFLVGYGRAIDDHAEEIAIQASLETGLPEQSRFLEIEIPRTTDQLFQAAHAALESSWKLPTIDRPTNIRSQQVALGKPVVIFGPSNFPLAFNAISGGDFAAAIAAGNAVIAKAHPLHPGTTKLLAELALLQLEKAGLPSETVQMLYHCTQNDGVRLASNRRVGAFAHTGSREAGLQLKAAADQAGIPIFLEMSSLNPVVILAGALRENLDGLVDQLVGSALLASGQFCTNPGLVLLIAGDETEDFIERVAAEYDETTPDVLLSQQGLDSLHEAVAALAEAGAEISTGGEPIGGAGGFRHQNTLLRVDGERFIEAPEALQREAFGNATLCVVAADESELTRIVDLLEGSLAGAVYSARSGADDALVEVITPKLEGRVGRLLNDKMPTGVAVVPSMVHGGPFPATGHHGFTSVGLPASMRRFSRPLCYDGVRANRLPPELKDISPIPGLWRFVDGRWMKTPG